MEIDSDYLEMIQERNVEFLAWLLDECPLGGYLLGDCFDA